MSKLYFNYGAMNCGKSTALLQVAHNYFENGKKVIVLKPAIDTKGAQKVVSRLGASRDVDYLVGADERIPEIDDSISCILVDEAQFLTPEQVDQLYEIAKLQNIPVMCYGLRTDFKGNGFPGASRLLELADEIKESKTICECEKKATHNARFINGVQVFDGPQVLIDGTLDVTYKPMCGSCYINAKYKMTNKKLTKEYR